MEVIVRKRSWPAVSHCIEKGIRFEDALFCRRFRDFSFSGSDWGYEVDADSVIEGGGEVVFDVAHQHAGFADAGVADDEDFEELGVAGWGEMYFSGLL